MVMLFSNRKSKLKNEIIEILTAHGADIISDNFVLTVGGCFTVINFFKVPEIKIKKGIAVIVDDTKKFEPLKLSKNVMGISYENNKNAIRIFEKNGNYTVTCGNNAKNTLTISSINNKSYILSLQRELIDINGNKIYSQDYKCYFENKYSNEAILITTAILSLLGLKP